MEARKPIENIWEQIDGFERLDEEGIKKLIEDRKKEAENRGQLSSESDSNPEMWRMQGLRFLKQKNYNQAIKCFSYAGD